MDLYNYFYPLIAGRMGQGRGGLLQPLNTLDATLPFGNSINGSYDRRQMSGAATAGLFRLKAQVFSLVFPGSRQPVHPPNDSFGRINDQGKDDKDGEHPDQQNR